MPIKIFTTRPDTIFGVSFVALAHDSHKVKELLKANSDNWIDQYAYERYLEQIRLSQKDTKEINLDDMEQGL
jgi:leucyl-tRNA synthetase